MAEALKPFIGLKDAVYCLMDVGTDTDTIVPTYQTVYPFTGIVELGFDSGASSTILFADDGANEAAETVGEMKITLNVKGLLQADRARILGHTDALGTMAEKVSDVSPYIAIGGKRMMAGGEYEYFWLPKCMLTKPKHDAKTKAASIEFQTSTFEGSVVRLNYNGVYRTRTVTDNGSLPAATKSGWFNTPVYVTGANLNALNCVIAKATTNITFTFSKTGNASFTLLASSVTQANMPVWVGVTGTTPVAGAYTIGTNPGTSVVVTFTPTSAIGAVPTCATVIGGKVFDTNSVSCASTAIVIAAM
jgi:phi13 family phage major tail protein